MASTPFADLIKAASEAKFTVIPASDYPVACRDAQATKSSTSKDMVKMSCKVIVGPHKGANLITQQTLSPENPAAVAIFLRFLDSFGISEDDLLALPPREDGGPNIAAVCGMLKSRVAMATVSIGQWQEEDRNYIDRFKKLNAEQQAAVEEALKTDGASLSDPLGNKAADPFAGASASADPTAGKAAGDPF